MEEAENSAIQTAAELEEQKQRALHEAERITENLQEKQEMANQQKQQVQEANAKRKALKKKLDAMQEKLLIGEAKGGLLNMAKNKQAEVQAQQEILQLR